MLRFAFTTLLCLQAREHLLAAQRIGDSAPHGIIAHDILEGGDSDGAETGFASAVQAGSKYFQYAHVPEKDHYEVGHKRGNDHHFIERHEKAHPHAGEFKTKVRWGDKHGGYGEHYWDYNHAGHDEHDGEESQQAPQYAQPDDEDTADEVAPRHYRAVGVASNEHDDDVEFVGLDGRRRAALSGSHGGNYRRERRRRQFDFL